LTDFPSCVDVPKVEVVIAYSSFPISQYEIFKKVKARHQYLLFVLPKQG
jgi:hypothetical protein